MKDLEDELPDKNINLAPLFKSIEELKKAATKIDSQREVSIVCLRNHDLYFHFTCVPKLKHNSPGNRTTQRLAIYREERSF